MKNETKKMVEEVLLNLAEGEKTITDGRALIGKASYRGINELRPGEYSGLEEIEAEYYDSTGERCADEAYRLTVPGLKEPISAGPYTGRAPIPVFSPLQGDELFVELEAEFFRQALDFFHFRFEKVIEHVAACYEIGVNPLPALRRQFPAFSFQIETTPYPPEVADWEIAWREKFILRVPVPALIDPYEYLEVRGDALH